MGVSLLTLLGFIMLSALIGSVTGSSFLGICGPYGSDTALIAMLILVLVGLGTSFWVGIRFLRGGRSGGSTPGKTAEPEPRKRVSLEDEESP